MNPTQTGIAVALALAVVVMFFVLPGLSPFRVPAVSETAPVDTTLQTTSTMTTGTSVTELQIIDETVGTGAAAEAGDTVTVSYVGTLTDGTVFDASANRGDEGFTFTLGAGQVIQGWDQGLLGMKEGGKRRLVIPAALAYGEQEVGGGIIPANSTLIFEVELLKVQKPAR